MKRKPKACDFDYIILLEQWKPQKSLDRFAKYLHVTITASGTRTLAFYFYNSSNKLNIFFPLWYQETNVPSYCVESVQECVLK